MFWVWAVEKTWMFGMSLGYFSLPLLLNSIKLLPEWWWWQQECYSVPPQRDYLLVHNSLNPLLHSPVPPSLLQLAVNVPGSIKLSITTISLQRDGNTNKPNAALNFTHLHASGLGKVTIDHSSFFFCGALIYHMPLWEIKIKPTTFCRGG